MSVAALSKIRLTWGLLFAHGVLAPLLGLASDGLAPTIILIVLAVLVVVVVRHARRVMAGWRSVIEAEGLQALGDANGYKNHELRNQLLQFPVCSGRSSWGFTQGLSNVLQGERDGVRVTVVEYWRSVVRGNSDPPRTDTHLVCFDSPADAWPPFTLHDRAAVALAGTHDGSESGTPWLDPGAFAARTDVDLSDAPAVAAGYRLRAQEPEDARALFTPDALAFLAAHRGWNVEAMGRVAVVYQLGRRLGYNELRPYLAEARDVLSVLRAGRGQ